MQKCVQGRYCSDRESVRLTFLTSRILVDGLHSVIKDLWDSTLKKVEWTYYFSLFCQSLYLRVRTLYTVLTVLKSP